MDLESTTFYALALEEQKWRTEGSLRRALEYFRRVIHCYPDFPPALVDLAHCLTLLGHAGFAAFTPQQVLPEARRAAGKALGIARDDETRASALTALAKIQLMFDWEWQQSEENFERALSLNRSHAPTYQAPAHLYLITERHRESLEAFMQARRLAPSSPMIYGTYGWILVFRRPG